MLEWPVTRPSPFVIVLSSRERAKLEGLARRPTVLNRMAIRARIVLAAAAGAQNVVIADRFGVAVNTVSKWRKRFFEERISGLGERKRSGRPRSFSPSGRRRGQTTGV